MARGSRTLGVAFLDKVDTLRDVGVLAPQRKTRRFTGDREFGRCDGVSQLSRSQLVSQRRYINHAHFGRCPGASSPTFCLGRHNKTCSDLQSKTRRRALQSDCGAQRLFECARLERRILGVLRRTGACSSALPHTPTRRELFCRRIVGPEMARIGFERNAALEERVFTIAFLSLMDGLKPIHSRRERRVH